MDEDGDRLTTNQSKIKNTARKSGGGTTAPDTSPTDTWASRWMRETGGSMNRTEKAMEAPDDDSPYVMSHKIGDYQRPHTRARVLQGLLILSFFFILVEAGIFWDRVQLIESIRAGASGSWVTQRATTNDALVGLANTARPFLYLLILVVFLTWVHRFVKNANALTGGSIGFTPGWAVGWFFVPFFCTYKPYQAIRDAWKASIAPRYWKGADGGSLLPIWWITALAVLLFSKVASSDLANSGTGTLAPLQSISEAAIGVCILQGIVIVLTLIVVRRLTAVQDRTFHGMTHNLGIVTAVNTPEAKGTNG